MTRLRRCRFTSNFQSLPVHPAFRLNLCEPILSRRNSSQIFLNVLFPDIAHWDFLPIAVGDRDAEDPFTQENAFRMMAKGAVTEVGKNRLRLIKPGMNWQVVFGLTGEPPCGALCVFARVWHGQNSLVS